ncbi:MAG: flavin reductase family protein [Promethearchaeati archaeon SRVP18_Atabeyarchaeia-1]
MSSRKDLKPATILYPTPVVLATSVDEKGKPNICTLAASGILSGNPPRVSISVRPSRYSHGLITTTREYVINIPTVDIVRETDYCGIVSGRSVDKFKVTKLTPMEAKKVMPPIIGECPVSLECRVKDIMRFGSHDVFVGEVVNVNVDDRLLGESKNIDYAKLKPITWNPITEEYHSLGECLGKAGYSRKTYKTSQQTG